jgi:hypothetical protein
MRPSRSVRGVVARATKHAASATVDGVFARALAVARHELLDVTRWPTVLGVALEHRGQVSGGDDKK